MLPLEMAPFQLNIITINLPCCLCNIHMHIIILYIFLHTAGSAYCRAAYDELWKVMWPNTASNTTALQKCPGGAKSIGQL